MSGAWAASVVSSGGSGSAPKNAPSARIASPVASVAQVAPVADVASDRKTPLEEDQLEPVDSKDSAGEWTCTVSTIVAVGLSVARIVPSGSLCEAAYSASTTSNTVRGSGSGWAATGMLSSPARAVAAGGWAAEMVINIGQAAALPQKSAEDTGASEAGDDDAAKDVS
jgi:hypothetical protein